MASTSVLLTRGSFYSPRKALEIFPGAYPVTDRRFNVCFIGTNMLFGLKTSKKLFISQSNGAFNSLISRPEKLDLARLYGSTHDTIVVSLCVRIHVIVHMCVSVCLAGWSSSEWSALFCICTINSVLIY